MQDVAQVGHPVVDLPSPAALPDALPLGVLRMDRPEVRQDVAVVIEVAEDVARLDDSLAEWRRKLQVVLRYIPGIINVADQGTKPLSWVLLSRHARRAMGHHDPRAR